MRAKILMVDDEPAIREMVGFHLARYGYAFREAADAAEAEREIRVRRPDLILLDWMMPGKSGIEYAAELRRDHYTRDIAIILLTARGEEDDKILGLEAGADDYITKPFSAKELVARMRTLLRRLTPEKVETAVEIGGLRLDPNTHEVKGNGARIKLGPTEFRLLHFLITHTERVYSRQDVLNYVWGADVVVKDRTVDVHIRRLRQALETTGHDRLIHTVRGRGYRLSESLFV